MYLVEIITEDVYYSVSEPFTSPHDAAHAAAWLRRLLHNDPGFVAVRVVNLAFATRW
jgi:hypothetical protein